MKKEIKKLLESEVAYLKINKYITLKRWTKNAFDDDVDCLTAVSSIEHYSDGIKYIQSRDWQGIIEEVNAFQKEQFNYVAERYCSQLSNGYLLDKEVRQEKHTSIWDV